MCGLPSSVERALFETKRFDFMRARRAVRASISATSRCSKGAGGEVDFLASNWMC